MRSATASTPSMSSDWPLTGPRHSVARARIPAPIGDETTVVKMHSGNGEHDEMDRRAIACFDQALADVGLADDDALATSAARLLRLGDHDNDVPLPPVRR